MPFSTPLSRAITNIITFCIIHFTRLISIENTIPLTSSYVKFYCDIIFSFPPLQNYILKQIYIYVSLILINTFIAFWTQISAVFPSELRDLNAQLICESPMPMKYHGMLEHHYFQNFHQTMRRYYLLFYVNYDYYNVLLHHQFALENC